MSHVVIVGASVAGGKLALNLRSQGFTGDITLVDAEDDPFYDKPPLSKEYLAQERPFDRLYIRPAQYWQDKQVDLLLGRTVTAVDPATHTVTCADGETIVYGQLIWATGGDPRALPVPGGDLPGEPEDHLLIVGGELGNDPDEILLKFVQPDFGGEFRNFIGVCIKHLAFAAAKPLLTCMILENKKP